MLEKSCGWWPIWYLLFFCHGGAEGQLQWVVKEKITDYGQNVTLFCPVENCCSELAGWSVGLESIFIDLKKYSNDSSKKYGGTYNKDGFGVVIRNLSEADLNVTHRCDYGFNRSTPKYLLHDDVFTESTDVPDKNKDKEYNTVTESNTVTENNTVTIVLSIVVPIAVIGIVIVAIIIVCRRKNKKPKSKDSSLNQEKVPLLEVVGDFHEAILKKYRTKPKIPEDLVDDKTFLSKLLEECGKNTEGLDPHSSGGIAVEYFPASLLVVVMKYRPEKKIVEEVLKDMLTTLTSQPPSTVVIVYHRSVKTAMEKVCKEDCKEQIEIFKNFIKDHKFDYSGSSCIQQCIDK